MHTQTTTKIVHCLIRQNGAQFAASAAVSRRFMPWEEVRSLKNNADIWSESPVFHRYYIYIYVNRHCLLGMRWCRGVAVSVHEIGFLLTDVGTRTNENWTGLLPSLSMPTRKHFWKRQAWQAFLRRLVISHSPLAGHEYSIFPVPDKDKMQFSINLASHYTLSTSSTPKQKQKKSATKKTNYNMLNEKDWMSYGV